MVTPIHTTSVTTWFSMRAAASMRWRRRCSVTAALSSPMREAPARHHRPEASERSAMRRTARRMAKPETRVTRSAPSNRATTMAARGHPPEYDGSPSTVAVA